MIIVRIWEGLGNQMFQYAYARALKAKGMEVRLDLEKAYDNVFSKYVNHTARKNRVQNFRISIPSIDVYRYGKYDYLSQDTLMRKAVYWLGSHSLWKYKFYEEQGPESLPKNIEGKGNYYVKGWFQDEGYFKDIRPILLREFTKHRYTREAHGRKKWGYIPDIVRLEKLHECGGFYFDTDVRMVRNLDPLRYEEAFCSRERAGHVNFGGGSGCVKGSSIVRKILDYRIDEPFDLGNGLFNGEASGYYESAPLMELGLEIEDTNQKLEGINVYASEFFSPYNYINGENIQNDNTFSIHCFQGSWTEDGNAARKETREQYEGFRARMEKVSSQRESRSKARKGPAF